MKSVPKEISDAFAQKVTCQESIEKLMRILKEDLFENGTVVDYYD